LGAEGNKGGEAAPVLILWEIEAKGIVIVYRPAAPGRSGSGSGEFAWSE